MIGVERLGAVRTVVLAHPEKRNAINTGMLEGPDERVLDRA